MKQPKTCRRRGIVEGFSGPLWSMEQRKKVFEFGAVRGMNTYLYAPVVSCEEIHLSKIKNHTCMRKTLKKSMEIKVCLLPQEIQRYILLLIPMADPNPLPRRSNTAIFTKRSRD